MNLLNKKYLYVNGCSFTAGDRLPEGQEWPVLLSKNLNLELINDSVNGNSFDTIFNTTVSKLTKFREHNNKLAIIGTTWVPRYGFFFEDISVNITPSDIDEKQKLDFGDKLSTWRRLSSPHTSNNYIKTELHNNIKSSMDGYNKVCINFTKYYKSLIEYDSKLKDNQILNFAIKLLTLQSFFKYRSIDYLFVDFGNIKNVDINYQSPTADYLFKEIDFNNVVQFNFEEFEKKYIDNITAHPNQEGCKFITDTIINKLNEI